MPNTPVAVGEGVSYALSQQAKQEDEDLLRELLSWLAFGQTRGKAVGYSSAGCGPAFVYLFIEALADGVSEQDSSRHISNPANQTF